MMIEDNRYQLWHQGAQLSNTTIDDDFDNDRGTLTLDKLLEATAKFRAMPPVAIQIYFVDRLEQYRKLGLIFNSEQESQRITSLIPPLFGIPLYNVKSADYTDNLPSCCATPGIWAIMSDGTQRQLDGESKPQPNSTRDIGT